MKQMFAMFILLGVVLFAVSMGSAHLRLDETFVIPMVPDNISVDGDGEEWQMLTDPYYLTQDEVRETVKGGFDNPNPASLAFKLAWGWSPVTNLLYMWEERFDDFNNARLTDGDRQENVEFGIDADHSGGRFMGLGSEDLDPARWDGSQGQSYRYYLNREDPLWHWGSATWADKPPYGLIGWSLDGEIGGEGVQTVEIAVTLWDDLNSEGVEASTIHTLAAGEIVGIVTATKDSDDPDDSGYDGGWWSSSFATADCCADSFIDYILLPFEPAIWTAVEADSWGRIKSTFRE